MKCVSGAGIIAWCFNFFCSELEGDGEKSIRATAVAGNHDTPREDSCFCCEAMHLRGSWDSQIIFHLSFIVSVLIVANSREIGLDCGLRDRGGCGCRCIFRLAGDGKGAFMVIIPL